MKEQPLPQTTKWLMRGTAIFFDVLSIAGLLPAIGWIIAWIVWILFQLTFFVWFKIHGRSFSSPKFLRRYIIGSIVEFIPEINVLPGYTVTIWLLTSDNMLVKAANQIPTKNNVVKFPNKNLGRIDKLDKAA